MTIINQADNVLVGSTDIDKIMLGADQMWISGYVAAPNLTVTGSPSDVPETPTMDGGAFTLAGPNPQSDTHVETEWSILDSGDATVWSQTSTS